MVKLDAEINKVGSKLKPDSQLRYLESNPSEGNFLSNEWIEEETGQGAAKGASTTALITPNG